MDTLQLVREFQEKAGHYIPNNPDLSNQEINEFRIKLIDEEFNIELKEAIKSKDKIKVFDALLDIQYVLDGTFLQLGYGNYKNEGFKEVHRSNMSKDFSLKNINIPHKITKGKDYSPPDLENILS